MPQKFYLDKIPLHLPVTFCEPESVLHIIHPDQASKAYLHIMHKCTL